MTSPLTKVYRPGNRMPLKVLDAGHFKIDGIYCKLIPLSRELYTIVWESDYEQLSQFNWCASWDSGTRSYYAKTNMQDESGKKRTVSMHRIIMGIDKTDSRDVDHKDPIRTLDNTRSNLRISTRRQNAYNRRPNRNTKAKLKGVTWHERDKIYEASIRINGKLKYLGRSANPAKCHEMYCEAAKATFGEFARFE